MHLLGVKYDGFSDWTPKGKFVTLFLNGTYQGLYFLCEKIERNEARLNLGENDVLLCTNRHTVNGAPFHLKTKGGLELDIEEDDFSDDQKEFMALVKKSWKEHTVALEKSFEMLELWAEEYEESGNRLSHSLVQGPLLVDESGAVRRRRMKLF